MEGDVEYFIHFQNLFDKENTYYPYSNDSINKDDSIKDGLIFKEEPEDEPNTNEMKEEN